MDEDVRKNRDRALEILKELKDLEAKIYESVKGRVVEFDEDGNRTIRGVVDGIGHNTGFTRPWIFLVVRIIRKDGSLGTARRYPSIDKVRFVEEVNG